ncbi:MAG TPA: [protein-PII] uridylyltransferase [Acidimicrobiales bacterium]|nr:[protein-PII] uridylyltransferase [Acidimicrobiales bacterium]
MPPDEPGPGTEGAKELAGSAALEPDIGSAWERLRGDTSLQGRAWSHAAGEVVSTWLAAVFARAVRDAPPPRPASNNGPINAWRARRAPTGQGSVNPAGLALVAVGSLGRGDMAPASDLDLLLVHNGRGDIAALADRIWYPIWDGPLRLDHSVRTLPQVVQAAESDLRVALGLVDARLIAGDTALGAQLLATGRRLWDKRVGKWLPEAIAARTAVELAQGEVAFLVEPELQESRGGLRDVQLLSLMAAVTPVVSAVVADSSLLPAADLLHSVRVELQRVRGYKGERLMLEDQDRVAAALGFGAREILAHEVAAAGRTVAWLVEDATRRVRSWLAGPRGRAGSADRLLEPGVVLRDGEVAIPLTADLSDAALALRAAYASVALGVPLARATMQRLCAEPPQPERPWNDDLRRAFLRLVSAGPGSTHAIETLDQIGVWERYLPEWAGVRNLPQFNPYHRWTVDRHLLETAVNATDDMLDVRRPDLLVLGALLHDIGKGTGRDHSRAGAEMVEATCERLGLALHDSLVLHRLVEHHLVLPDTATRRDLDDPATIAMVAEVAEDTETLELLAALAAADGRATGPSAWTPWKANLVHELVQRVGAVLEGRPMPPASPFPSAEQRALLGSGARVILAGHELIVVAPDRPGLFGDVAGALALHNIAVLEARAHSEAGEVLDVFALDLPEGADPRWPRVVADVQAVLAMQLNVSEALARRPVPRRAQRTAAPLAQALRVMVDNDAASHATVVEVRAPDSPGLLHRIAAALARLDLEIVSARVATLGNAVVDTFYVRAAGSKADPADARRIESTLQSALGTPELPANS